MRWLYFQCFFLLFGLPSEFVSGVCELPGSWSGEWFESGVREGVNISGHQLSHKGSCVHSRQQTQFIFKDREEGCLRCLSMHEKHRNILQYKESKCVSMKNYKKLCHSISVDEPLKTLFRVGSSPEQCPLRGHFTFSYSRGHGQCSYPLSSLSQCENGSSLVFRYQACPDIKGSETRVERAHCIASWREGSTDYFVARLENHKTISSERGTSFRCFVYKKNYAGFDLSMSGAPECNLYTATEGQTTFTINNLGDSENVCVYPAWLRKHRKYISLQGNLQYHLNHRGSILTLRRQPPPGPDSESQLEELNKLECSEIVEQKENLTRLVALSTKDCESGFQCVEVEGVSTNVVLLRVGRLTHSPGDACNTNLFFNSILPVVLTSVHLPFSACPITGQLEVRSVESNQTILDSILSNQTELQPAPPNLIQPTSKCPYLASSCRAPHSLSFSPLCGKYSAEYACHESWESSGGRLVILSQHQQSANRFCILVRKEEEETRLRVVRTCTPGRDGDTNLFTASFYGDCSPTALATANRGTTAVAEFPSLVVAAVVQLYLCIY